MERYTTHEEAHAINEIYLDRERRQTGRMPSSNASCPPTHTSPGAVAESLAITRTRTLPPQNPNGPHAAVHPALREGTRGHCNCWECNHDFFTSTDAQMTAHLSRSALTAEISPEGRNDTQGVEGRPYSPSATPEPDELGETEDPMPEGWRMYIHNFTTQWFCINMGTGNVPTCYVC